ncbi:actin-like ATPase domain-containing protein [Gigaspora margarita]|uniref:Phosphotransferase n=1 Tax=Gigaspora margarita TaxID=4874 RepID=A0A8H3XHX8_GIGMA|nr:actin-like ATPase domain-containing protein [Gigaspora margarita]
MDEPALTLSALEKQMVFDRDKLQSIIDGFIVAYHHGLTNDDTTMIPSYVSRLPTGAETGTYLSLDLGGTNLRVAAVTLLGDGKADIEQKKYVIPAELKVGHVEKLLDWVALGVKELLGCLGIQVEIINEKEMYMGVTFSFPIRQTDINRGLVMKMGKGFEPIGLEGQDIIELLQAAFKRQGIKIHISAIVNDSVGTFVANAYKDQNTIVSVILSTGTNASCICQTSSISKHNFPHDSPEYMIVNTEWGIMGMDFLPRIKYDKILDLQSNKPGFQPFEKMVSGYYLGELVRLAMVDYVKNFGLFDGVLPNGLEKPYNFTTKHMSDIGSDKSTEYNVILKIFTEDYNKSPSLDDRRTIHELVLRFSRRSAQLSAAAIASLIKLQCPDFPAVERDIRVAVDGSLYHRFHEYSSWMNKTFREIQRIKEDKRTKIVPVEDGGCMGAAITAMMYSH